MSEGASNFHKRIQSQNECENHLKNRLQQASDKRRSIISNMMEKQSFGPWRAENKLGIIDSETTTINGSPF